MDNHLSRIQRETKFSLHEFQKSGMKFDSQFRTHILKLTRDR